MKKHEACFHLNEVIDETRSSVQYLQQKNREFDADASKSEAEKKSHAAYQNERIRKLELRLLALDMAGTGLTR